MAWMLRVWILAAGLLSSTSCHIVYLHMAEPVYQDRSLDARYQHLIGQWICLKQDSFLYQYSDTHEYAIEVPGQSTELPATIQDYQNDPLNWMHTDSFARQGKGKADGYYKLKVIAVLPKGTRLYVANVIEKQSSESSSISVMAYSEDPRYQSLPIDIYFLLKRNQQSFTGDSLNPDFLEFCHHRKDRTSL